MWRIRVERQHEPPQTCVNTDRTADGFHKHGLQQEGCAIGNWSSCGQFAVEERWTQMVLPTYIHHALWRTLFQRPCRRCFHTVRAQPFFRGCFPGSPPEHDDQTSLSQPKRTHAIQKKQQTSSGATTAATPRRTVRQSNKASTNKAIGYTAVSQRRLLPLLYCISLVRNKVVTL